MHVDVHLRAIRDECGLTQAEVCEILDHSEGWLSKLETGKLLPPLGKLIRLARVYKRHPFDLYTFPHFPPPRTLPPAVCAACGHVAEGSPAATTP